MKLAKLKNKQMIVLSKIKFCTLPVQLIFTDEVMRENGIYFIDLIGNYVLNEKFVKKKHRKQIQNYAPF